LAAGRKIDGIIDLATAHSRVFISRRCKGLGSVVWTTDSGAAAWQNASSVWSSPMSDSDYSRKCDLECLRMASDLVQLAAETLNPHLKAHCLRMAKVWSGEAEQLPEFAWAEQTNAYSALLH
jgi:hypothetical protein